MRTPALLGAAAGFALAFAAITAPTATADPLTDFLCASGSAQFCPAPPPPPPPPPTDNCHPSYDPCLPIVSDIDCEGGSGNGPYYTGPVRVIGPDDYGLDHDGDGFGCENS